MPLQNPSPSRLTIVTRSWWSARRCKPRTRRSSAQHPHRFPWHFPSYKWTQTRAPITKHKRNAQVGLCPTLPPPSLGGLHMVTVPHAEVAEEPRSKHPLTLIKPKPDSEVYSEAPAYDATDVLCTHGRYAHHSASAWPSRLPERKGEAQPAALMSSLPALPTQAGPASAGAGAVDFHARDGRGSRAWGARAEPPCRTSAYVCSRMLAPSAERRAGLALLSPALLQAPGCAWSAPKRHSAWRWKSSSWPRTREKWMRSSSW
jgi:hypothetical protein